MAYATLQDLVDRFGAAELIQRTDRTKVPPEEIDADVVALHLADTDGLIDGYLKGRYALPLTPTPPALRKAACDIARRYILDESASDAVRKAFDEALRLLRDVADGRVDLTVEGEAPPKASGGGVQISAPARTFTDAALKGFLS